MSANYGWIITKDLISGPVVGEPSDLSNAGTMGPATIPYRITERLKCGEGTKFRLYDDDGELYYEGLYIGDLDEGDPLYDFGAPNAGCTYMDEFTNGEWKTIIA